MPAEGDPHRARPDESRRARILQAAAALFTEYGYEGTRMATLARCVGISAPALYWHFPSKDALFSEFMRVTLEDYVGRIVDAVTGSDPEGQLRQFVMAHVLFHLHDDGTPAGYERLYSNRQLFDALGVDQRARLIAPQRRVLELLRGILRTGEAAGTFEPGHHTVTAFAILTMCEHVFLWFRPDGELSPMQVAEEYADRVLAMVTAPTAGRGAGLRSLGGERHEMLSATPLERPAMDPSEVLTVLDRGDPLEVSFHDARTYHGYRSIAGIAHGFKAMQRAWPLLAGGCSPERYELRIDSAFAGAGARDAFEIVTRAFTGGRYRLVPEIAPADAPEAPEGSFFFRFRYRDTTVDTTLRAGFVSDEFLKRVRRGTQTLAEEETLTGMKQEMAAQIMALPPEEVYDADDPTG
ncbi:MAG: TetR/AcrR family transcriptional regulator [Egibacteraceae bacterium]